ncbi:MAG: DUF5606 domain-containing protein [Bacteroidetes bacterium]|nr:DUF5606 domain-containing protein [Bacteroidota bacterium]
MNLRGIVAVAGKPGLWKAIAQNKNGFILESIDEHKTKLVANLNTAKIAALDEITIFGYDDDIKLTDVLERMKAVKSIPEAKADGRTLRELFLEVAPDHDTEKVYASDMKKIVGWFHILKDLPEFEEATPAAETQEEEEEQAKEPIAEEVKESRPAKKSKATEEPAAPKAKKK